MLSTLGPLLCRRICNNIDVVSELCRRICNNKDVVSELCRRICNNKDVVRELCRRICNNVNVVSELQLDDRSRFVCSRNLEDQISAWKFKHDHACEKPQLSFHTLFLSAAGILKFTIRL